MGVRSVVAVAPAAGVLVETVERLEEAAPVGTVEWLVAGASLAPEARRVQVVASGAVAWVEATAS